jgi:hypothetical protein
MSYIPNLFLYTSFDLLKLPDYIDNQLGIGTFAAGLFLTLGVVAILEGLLIYLSKGKATSLYVLMGLIATAPFIAIGWFPVWLYIVIVLAIAVGLSEKIGDYLGGLRR